MKYGQYFFIGLMLIGAVATARDPFNRPPQPLSPATAQTAAEQTDGRNHCNKSRLSVIASDIPLSELHIRGVIIRKDKQSVLLNGGGAFFIAHSQDFIAKEALQIIAVEKKEVRLADWLNSLDCERPNVRTLRF